MFSPTSPRPGYLGPYRITRKLGIGATSEVLLAVSEGPYGFERTVVIKRLLPQCEVDPALHRRLAAEAVAYARLTHPAIVRLYDFFAPDGHVALVLEYVDGPSLARLGTLLKAKREALGDPAALYIASRVFSALTAAHSARDPHNGEFAPVIHRDVSPGNILIPWDGFVKLGDFGMAKVSGVSGDSRSGTLKGTYGYMAPEQVMGDRVSPRTDVYAGCVLLRELLLSRPTFTQGKMAELEYLKSMADPQLTPLEKVRGGISRALADAMRRGLAADPEQRTLTASEMVSVLRDETDMERAHAALAGKLSRVRPPEARASTPSRGVPHAAGSAPSTTVRLNRVDLPPFAPDPPDSEPPGAESRPNAYETPNTMTLSAQPPRMPLWSALVEASADTRRRAAVVAAAALVGIAISVAAVVAIRRASSPSPRLAATARNTVIPRDAARALDAGAGAGVALGAPHAARPPQLSASPPAPASGAPFPVPPAPALLSTAPAATSGEILTPPSAHAHRVFVDGQFAAGSSGATLSVRCGRHTVRIGSAGRLQSIDVPCGGSIAVPAR